MMRFTLALMAVTGVLTIPLLDAATKGTFVLILSGLGCWLLRRDSAATRHCILTVAIAMLLLIPVLSYSLPQWRILPTWAMASSFVAIESLSPSEVVAPSRENSFLPPDATRQAHEAEPSAAVAGALSDSLPNSSLPALGGPPPRNSPQTRSLPSDVQEFTKSVDRVDDDFSMGWWSFLPSVWLIGVMLLATRLLVSAIQLRLSEFRCSDGSEILRPELTRAMQKIGLKRGFRVWLDPKDSVPIVWGLLVPRLRLPAAALHWSKEQLHSVLLHELAHLRRFDLFELLLTQLACALHWYNPLVWLAGRKLHTERERACDDLVLSCGVKASSYAQHLLHVSASSAAGKWSQVCGLAMARQSSLEGRLRAVLSDNHQRRRASVHFFVASIGLGVCLTIPIAMLGAATEIASEPNTSASGDVEVVAVVPTADETKPVEPSREQAKSLFQKWSQRARTDGKIPGALIGQLASKIDEFVTQYPNDAGAKQFAQMRSRLDSSRDWPPSDVAVLLDEIEAITSAPIGWLDMSMEFDSFRTIQPGQPLPDDLKAVAWGPAAENGLRAAWLLDLESSEKPNAKKDDSAISSYPLGSVLKVRVLFHNSGDKPVVFRTETWHQSDRLTVHDAQGAEIKTSGTWYTGITPLVIYRLMPGQYCEVSAPGVGIGAGDYVDERSTGRLGVVIEAQSGDEVSLSCLVDAAQGISFSRPEDPSGQPELWKKMVADRIGSEAPLPQNAADREQLLKRVMLDLTGVAPTTEELTQFVANTSPQALDDLVARIQAIAPIEPWTGKLPTGTTKFRVADADPKAATRPRLATAPGRYVLSDSVHLLVTQETAGDAPRKNSAQIAFLSQDPSVASPHAPFQIKLPDGLNSYAMLWVRNSSQLQIVEPGSVRTIDFSDPGSVKETQANENLSSEFQALVPEGLRKTLPHASNDDRGVELDPSIESQLDWGEAVNGLRGALIIRPQDANNTESVYLVLQNVSNKSIRFRDTTKSDRLNSIYVSAAGEILFAVSNDEPSMIDVVLEPRQVTYLALLKPANKEVNAGFIEGIRKDALQTWRAVLRMSQVGVTEAWRGDLSTGETRCEIRPELPQPQHEAAQALFKFFQANARRNGDIPGGLLHRLHDKVKEFIRNNESDASGAPYARKMTALEPRFANANDWKPADVVALLDDIAMANSIPLETTLMYLSQHKLYPGMRLPKSLENVDWGAPLPSGLRMAYVLSPLAESYHLGSEVKARIIFHNAGSEPVAFITNSFQQPSHVARRPNGNELELESTHWLTLGSMVAYRLAPGEYCEVSTPGLGIGAQVKDRDDWEDIRAGSWILCAAGDEVLLTPGPADLTYREGPETSTDWWLDFITERLEREAPVPVDRAEREYLLYRVKRELFGSAPSTTEGDAFAADSTPDALKHLATLLAKNPYGQRSAGTIQAGQTKFRVLPPDTAADRRPRIATGPGSYRIGDGVYFMVNRNGSSDTLANEARIAYYNSNDPVIVHNVTLPHGLDTWAAATLKDSKELWVAQPQLLRKFDVTDPAKPIETRFEGEQLDGAPIPNALRAALESVLKRAEVEDSTSRKPATPAAEAAGNAIPTPPAASDDVTAEAWIGTWRGEMNGEAIRFSFHKPPAESEVQLDIYFGDATIGLITELKVANDGRSISVFRSNGREQELFGTLHRTSEDQLRLKTTSDANSDPNSDGIILIRDRDEPASEPKQTAARELFDIWKATANEDGTIPGAFVGRLATEVQSYAEGNANLDSGMKLAKLLPRFTTTRDWSVSEAARLLDDVAYYSTKPIEACVEKAKLSSRTLWRATVEFQDIPVPIVFGASQAKECESGYGLLKRIGESAARRSLNFGSTIQQQRT
ncbi:MAG: DUF1549 domain-containing protein [Planctomycetaceae bacterium]|nr:DUF1549 domain-containing protein [Planctomycetaceae bacterium]